MISTTEYEKLLRHVLQALYDASSWRGQSLTQEEREARANARVMLEFNS